MKQTTLPAIASTRDQPWLKYVVISPVKDEADHIELTLRSMVAQSVKPLLWIIVDDGSRDGTPQIVERYAAEHPFILLITHRLAGVRQTGSAEVLAFNRGYELLATVDYDIIVKLDGDLSFGPAYFGSLLDHFRQDAKLGIASGVYLERGDGNHWQVIKMPSYHAFGACKVMRRECFDAIGRFAATPGWDTADEIRALHLGWRTRHFPELQVKHHKREGSGMGILITSVMHGEIYYVTSGDLGFFVLKVLHRITSAPYLLNGAALVFGYLSAALRRKPKLLTSTEAREYRQMLRYRLWQQVRKCLSL